MEDLISFMQWHKEHGPAQKEEVMPIETMNMPDDDFDYEQEMKAENAAERRALYREAYMAALSGLASINDLTDDRTVQIANGIALETVRQWDAMISQLDGEEG